MADDERQLLQANPLQGMRGVIARTMTQSLQEMAQLTLHRQVDTAALEALRHSSSASNPPSMTAYILRAASHALVRHPQLNATLEGGVISEWRTVNVGVAVAVDGGLVVPVVRGANALSLANLQFEVSRLARLARDGELSLSDLREATFTVTNLGAFGVDAFTPIVNPPQVAILGCGRSNRGTMWLSLTIDHRALDGAPAALFLEDVALSLERPSEN